MCPITFFHPCSSCTSSSRSSSSSSNYNKREEAASCGAGRNVTLLSLAVAQMFVQLFNFIIARVLELNFASASAGSASPPGMNTDRQIHRSNSPGPDDVTRPLSDTAAGEQGAGPPPDEPPRFHAVNYPDITSPVAGGWLEVGGGASAGKGQLSCLAGIKTSLPCMSRPLPAQPAHRLRPRHTFQRGTNASTRVLMALKMAQRVLLTRL